MYCLKYINLTIESVFRNSQSGVRDPETIYETGHWYLSCFLAFVQHICCHTGAGELLRGKKGTLLRASLCVTLPWLICVAGMFCAKVLVLVPEEGKKQKFNLKGEPASLCVMLRCRPVLIVNRSDGRRSSLKLNLKSESPMYRPRYCGLWASFGWVICECRLQDFLGL